MEKTYLTDSLTDRNVHRFVRYVKYFKGKLAAKTGVNQPRCLNYKPLSGNRRTVPENTYEVFGNFHMLLRVGQIEAPVLRGQEPLTLRALTDLPSGIHIVKLVSEPKVEGRRLKL